MACRAGFLLVGEKVPSLLKMARTVGERFAVV